LLHFLQAAAVHCGQHDDRIGFGRPANAAIMSRVVPALADRCQKPQRWARCACTLARTRAGKGNTMAKKKETLDPETLALIHWCIEVEGFLVAGGATQAEAQQHIEDEVEWFTDQYYEGLTPEQAAREALA
jgi:hypothetical protein